MTDVGMAAVGSLFLWSYAATSPIAGMVADRISRSRLIALSLAGWSIVTALTGFVTSTNQLYILRVLLGISECLYLPAALGLLADYHQSDTRATALGIHASGLNLGMIAGGTISGYLGEHFGWRPAFFMLGLIGFGLSMTAALWLRDTGETEAKREAREPLFAAVRSLAKIPSYGVIIAQAAIVAISTWIFANWLPLYFRETYGLTLAAAGFSGTFSSTVGVLSGVILGGYLSDRIAKHNVRLRLLVLGICYILSMPFLLMFLAQPSVAILGGSILVHGLIRAMGSANETPLLCDLLPAHRRSTAIGIMNASNTFFGGSGVLISGFLKSHYGLTGVFSALSGIVLLAAGVALAGYKWLLPADLARLKATTGETHTVAGR
jgi:MFS family permease